VQERSGNMFTVKCPIVHRSVPMRRKISRVTRSYYTINNINSKPLDQVADVGMFHILAFIRDGDTGIYSVSNLDDDGVKKSHIIGFRTFEDAFRYKTLLEAEMNMTPYVQFASRFELEHSCNIGNYGCRIVDEDALVTPPTKTVEITDWERRSALLEGRWTVMEKDDDK
jgi:hypothetical protein